MLTEHATQQVTYATAILFGVLGTVPAAQAALTASSDGTTVYDSNLNVYWLADANLAASNTFNVAGINIDGSMSWNTAQTWVAAMNSYNNGAGYLGHNNWTLPPTEASDPPPPNNCSLKNQSTGFGFGFNCAGSPTIQNPMGELFYTALGGVAGGNILLTHNPSFALFKNFQPYLYWSYTQSPPGAVSFSFGNGFQGTNLNIDWMYVIPEFAADGTAAPPTLPQLSATGTVVPAVSSNPSLVPSPDGKTVYDPTLNLTWLADGNLAFSNNFGLAPGSALATSLGVNGVNADGTMDYATSAAFINQMNGSSTTPGYLQQSGWTLPTSLVPDVSCSYQVSSNGFNCIGGQMGELFYTQWGGEAGSTLDFVSNSSSRLFVNIQPYLYWTSTPDTANANSNGKQTFSFGSGFQGGNFDANNLYIIPVLPGQIYVGSVGGIVGGLAGSGLALQDNLRDDLPIGNNGGFSFLTVLASGVAYNVTVKSQPAHPAQICTVSNASGLMGAANITNVTVTCNDSYSVGGTVSGLAGTGLLLQDNGGANLAITANGSFVFPQQVTTGSGYSVAATAQPMLPTQTCTVGNGSGTIASADVTNVTVACSVNNYAVGGTVSGLAGTGLQLQENGGTNLSIAANGNFTFPAPVPSGGTYSVTIATSPANPAQTCLISNPTGTIAAAAVTNVAISCTTPPSPSKGGGGALGGWLLLFLTLVAALRATVRHGLLHIILGFQRRFAND